MRIFQFYNLPILRPTANSFYNASGSNQNHFTIYLVSEIQLVSVWQMGI